MPRIEIESLTAQYGDLCVLDAVSIEIHHGELFFLVGPSGCGKTTLLRMIAGFLEPYSGSIRFDGEDVTKVPPHLRETAMVFQSYALWPHMTVAENVAFGLETRKVAKPELKERVELALESVHLPGSGSRRIGELSGGQQQRVALARALVVRPRCLLLDEPLSNLDAGLRRDMRFEIRSICKDHGLTGIYVTHDQEEALSMADRVAVMSKGRVQQMGTPQKIYRQPINREVAQFMGDTNLIELPVERVLACPQKLEGSLGGVRFTLEMPSHLPLDASFERLEVSIRPEAFRLAFPDDPSGFWGEILDVSYLGPAVSYRVSLKDGHCFKVLILNPGEPLPLQGERILLTLSAADIVPLRSL